MRCFLACFLLSWGISAILGLDVSSDYIQSCLHIAKRQEWRRLGPRQKAQFIGAMKCMQALPSNSSFAAARTRFDDFLAVHIHFTDEIHRVGQFLPWHRQFIRLFELSLQEECGFNGTLPYWNWSEDYDKQETIANSPVFDPIFGFGGNGVPSEPGYNGPFGNWSTIAQWTGGGCVTDGPFASYELSVGPGTANIKRCLRRAFTAEAMTHLSSKRVKEALSKTSFFEFDLSLEGDANVMASRGNPHTGGHSAVGGEMFNRYSSPGEPLFYLHHANIDRIWWQWQQMDSHARHSDIGGRSSVDPPFRNVTLQYGIKMGELGATIPIRKVMNTLAGDLCYVYV